MKCTTLYLKDGKTQLDTWPENFDHLPTIGDFLSIENSNSEFLNGYKKLAMVSMIEFDSGSRTRIYLEAELLAEKPNRTVVLLNENYIPESSRLAVESHLRHRLELPIFEWTRSYKPRPVIAIHATPAITKVQVRNLSEEIRQTLVDTGALALV